MNNIDDIKNLIREEIKTSQDTIVRMMHKQEWAERILDLLEEIDIPQAKESYWIPADDSFECLECEYHIDLAAVKKYCPNCGAKMMGFAQKIGTGEKDD